MRELTPWSGESITAKHGNSCNDNIDMAKIHQISLLLECNQTPKTNLLPKTDSKGLW